MGRGVYRSYYKGHKDKRGRVEVGKEGVIGWGGVEGWGEMQTIITITIKKIKKKKEEEEEGMA